MSLVYISNGLVPGLHVPQGEKWSGEQCQISWAYFQKVVTTNEIVRSLIVMYTVLTIANFIDSLLSCLYLFLSKFGTK